MTALTFLTLLSIIKLCITTVKYIPQALLNYQVLHYCHSLFTISLSKTLLSKNILSQNQSSYLKINSTAKKHCGMEHRQYNFRLYWWHSEHITNGTDCMEYEWWDKFYRYVSLFIIIHLLTGAFWRYTLAQLMCVVRNALLYRESDEIPIGPGVNHVWCVIYGAALRSLSQQKRSVSGWKIRREHTVT